jgi:ATP-dependent RNA helicase RhlE
MYLILTTQFSQFSLSASLMARLDANKFEIPTPVQVGCIPPALEGRDVLATAQTGTGKTLGYLIPIVEMMQKNEARGAQALICLPTRELAMQVEKAFLAIRSSSAQTVALVVGGLAERSQLDAIRRGARLIVATPGRLEDYIKRRLVRLDQVKILVLDEVDRMLDMGFQPAIARIAGTLPQVRQTLCYSATLEGQVKIVAHKYLKDPVRIEIGSVLKPAENVELWSTCWARRQAASWFLCVPSMARTAWPAGWSVLATPPRRFTATARRPSGTRRCAASPRDTTAFWWPPTLPLAALMWPM